MFPQANAFVETVPYLDNTEMLHSYKSKISLRSVSTLGHQPSDARELGDTKDDKFAQEDSAQVSHLQEDLNLQPRMIQTAISRRMIQSQESQSTESLPNVFKTP